MKPETRQIAIAPDVLQKWQRMVDLLANIMCVPAAVVTQLESPHFSHYRTVVSSQSPGNPFPVDELFAMNTGTFCETVIKSRAPLLVANALEDDHWTRAPEIQVGMVSYLGFPVLWPDGRMFGTLCVLDDKTNRYSDVYQEVLLHCRDVLQADLQTLARLGRRIEDLIAPDDRQEEQQRQRYHEIQLELAHANRIATLGQLSASIAHEINQPLAGIITNCATCLHMLTSDPPNIEGAREAVRRTLRDGNRASSVVARLRALFDRKKPASESVDLNEATREVIGLSLAEIQKSRVTVRTELADDLPTVTADRVQIQQVVLNLLRNALDAMSCVDDRPRELLIRTERQEGECVQLSVKDTGVGFDPRTLEKLFEVFYSSKQDGMGVGLSVSRSIIENHQGRLWAVANEGPGATFLFSVPCRADTLVSGC